MIIARQSEYEFYDPMRDKVMLRLQITEERGTWYTDIPAQSEPNMANTSERKAAFKTYVLQAMALGQLPKKVGV